MNKINTYDLFNKGDGVTGVYNVTIKALENLRPIELTRIEDDLRHHPQLREISTFLFTYCVNFLIDLLRWVDSNYSSMVYKMSANKDVSQTLDPRIGTAVDQYRTAIISRS